MLSNLCTRTLLALTLLCICGCYSIPLAAHYAGPVERPAELNEHYPHGTPYELVRERVIKTRPTYHVTQLTIDTTGGTTVIEFYDTQSSSDDLIFVFPVLGGRPILSRHFATYFAENGFDAAIVQRNNEFKDPQNVFRIEELFRLGTIRDRIAIDFFEQEYGKRDFGTFGISRGAINVAITAGIDPRLKYNIMALGAADLPGVFEHSRERRIKKFVSKVTAQTGMSRQELFEHFRKTIKTDPKYVAQHIDARNTLLLFALCDTTVPFRYGKLLRELIGSPETIYLFAAHRTAILYTGVIKMLLPFQQICAFPFEYIETEALAFFRRSFERDEITYKLLPFRILRFPLDAAAFLLGHLYDFISLQEN